MAQTKKTNSKAKANTKAKKTKASEKPEVLPDFWREYPLGENGETVELSLYDRGADKDDRVKLLIGGTFIIYCTAKVMDDYAFLSYPSFKTKDGNYINQAFSIDKELNEKINDDLTDYYFDD